MAMDDDVKVVLRTYNSVWKIPRWLYSIDKIKLWVPIDQNQAIYFCASVAITFLLLKIIPFLNALPFVFKYIAIPYGLMKFFTKQKLDGKLPHKFFLDYLSYKIMTKTSERFTEVKSLKKVVFSTPVMFRMPEVVNVTGQVLQERKGRSILPWKGGIKLV